MRTVKLDDIIIGDHVRKDLGDIDTLAASIQVVGLLQPVVVTPDLRLVCGRRRVAAFRQLGRPEIPVHVVEGLEDELKALLAEADENTCRKSFVPSEAVALGKAIEKKVRAQAKERQAQAGPAEGRGRKGTAPGKLPEALKGRTRDAVAGSVGMSPRNYEKARAVVDAAAADPELAPVVAEMDATGNVDRAYRTVRARKAAGQTAKGANPTKQSPAAALAPTPPKLLTAPLSRRQVAKIKRFLRDLTKAETFSDLRATVNTPTCLGLSTAGLDNVILSARKIHPELAPRLCSVLELLTGPNAARGAALVRTVMLLNPASRRELLAELCREQAPREGRADP